MTFQEDFRRARDLYEFNLSDQVLLTYELLLLESRSDRTYMYCTLIDDSSVVGSSISARSQDHGSTIQMVWYLDRRTGAII